MSYRRTRKAAAQARQEALQRGKARARQGRPAPEYPPELPELRVRIRVERFDFGHECHVFELRRSPRCDSYRVFVDGQFWRRCGISKVTDCLRKALPRTRSPRSLFP